MLIVFVCQALCVHYVRTVLQWRQGDAMQLKKLRAWRERRALSIRDLSERSKVATSTIVRIEQGGDANPLTVRRLAEALGVEPDALMEEAGE